MKLGSLCSGAAGLDMAVEQVFGATTAWHCEYDPAATKVLAHRYPGTPNHSDLTTTDWAAVEPIDILCAGWPCQPFSLAGRQKGAADERAIWPQIADAIRILRPRIVVLENVSAVLRHEFGRVANSLAQLGYDLRWRCVRASDVGAPHRRERLFVIATVADAERGGGTRFTQPRRHPETAGRGQADIAGRCGDPDLLTLLPTPCARQSGCTPEDSIKNKPPGRQQITDLSIIMSNPELLQTGGLLPTPTSRDGKGHNQRGDETCLTGALLPTPRATDGTNGGPNQAGTSGDLMLPSAVQREWGKYAAAIHRWEHITHPAPTPTEPNSKGNPRLNPAFSEWMMGWPQGWVTQVPGISRNDQLRIIGNGVVPQAAHHAIQTLLNVAEVVA